MEGWIILIIILLVFIGLFAGLYFFGKKMQKKQSAQQEQLQAAAQPVSMLIIDKKRMKIKEAGLPKMVLEQTPKYLRGSKMPIVKAKIGPQIMSLICDEAIFDSLPVKAEVKAMLSGIYIISVKNIRGGAPQPTKKPGFMARLMKKQQQLQDEVNADKAAKTAKKKNKK